MREYIKSLLKIQVLFSIRITVIHMLVESFKKFKFILQKYRIKKYLPSIEWCIMQYTVFVQMSINLILYCSFTILPVQKAVYRSKISLESFIKIGVTFPTFCSSGNRLDTTVSSLAILYLGSVINLQRIPSVPGDFLLLSVSIYSKAFSIDT